MTDASSGLPSLPELPQLAGVLRRPPAGGARRHWLTARVESVVQLTPTAKSFTLRLPEGAERHVPGQHYDVRLTAPDGSTAQRSYSVGSAPARGGEPPTIELVVERIAGGDVSPFLHELVGVGDEVEVRGPFGGWFIWRGDTPALLVGGGSGVVPLLSMLRWARHLSDDVARLGGAGPDGAARPGGRAPVHLVVSVRTPESLIHAAELVERPDVTVLHTRVAPAGSSRPAGRLVAADLEPVVRQFAGLPEAAAYVCGGAGFAEAASQLLVELGMPRDVVRVERFGPA